MIKMVCSDLDGTLLQYGKKLIEGEILMRSALCMTVVSCSARPAGGSIPACANCSPLWQTIASTCARTARLSTVVAK